MARDEVRVGDAGTVFQTTIYDGTSVVDLSLSTGKFFVFSGPNGTSSTVTVSYSGSGTAGVLVYTTTSTTFSVDGTWKLQAIVQFTASKFHSDIYDFRVYPNLT